MSGAREIEVVPAGATAVALLSELHAACFEEVWSQGSIARLLATPGAFALLAVEAERREPVGLLLARTAPGECEIIAIGVAAPARRHGAGRMLLQAAGARAAEAGAEALVLEVAERNEAARALYEGAGFRCVGRRPGYYPKAAAHAADALIMRLDLRRLS